MEILGYVFGIFGLVAFLEASSLKRRVDALEEQLAQTEGTPLHEDRRALLQAARSCIGRQVTLDLREDHEDADVVTYGNTKHGSNTVVDVDEDWMLVRVEGPRGSKDKLIRLGSIEGIALVAEG